MIADAWRIACRIGLLLGALLSLLALVELFRVFTFFYRIGPAWGWTFSGLALVLLVASLLYVRTLLSEYPRVLKAPPLPDLPSAEHKEMRAYCKYLVRYLRRLANNPEITETQAAPARQRADYLSEMLEAHPLNDDLRRGIKETEEQIVEPLLQDLGEQARKEVRRSVRDVMLGVSLSPYHSVDLLIVVYRNAAMVVRVAGIFASRPNSREQLLILRDVLRVIVTVNFLYIGRNLIENLFTNVPIIGRVVDDIGQGLGAGLLTSATGHAAIDRCAAYRGWSKRAAADSLASHTKAFLVDVRNIFTHDVLPDLRGRIRSELPKEAVEEPGFWDTLAGGINTAVDATTGVLGSLVVKPAVAGTRGVVQASSAISRSVSRAGTRRRRRHRPHRPSKSLFGTVGQRIKYAFKRPAP